MSGVRAGSIEGIGRWSYDGRALPVAADDLATAQITTRDIDRGSYPHYLLKEISESPASFRKTLRGKLVDTGDGPVVRLVRHEVDGGGHRGIVEIESRWRDIVPDRQR